MQKLVEFASDFLNQVPGTGQGDVFGIWAPTVALMNRLGATGAESMGDGIGLRLGKLSIETQVYPTNGVVAVGYKSYFNLAEAVAERRSFSLMIFDVEHRMNLVGVGFGPFPDSGDEVELARRYVSTLIGVFEQKPHLLKLDRTLENRLALLTSRSM